MKTREVKIGDRVIGNGNTILIQSMLSVPLTDIDNAIKQSIELENAGCEIIRAAVPDEASAKLIAKLKKHINVPLVADIHFNYRLAIMAVENGVDKLRINPGNIGGTDKLREVCACLKEYNIPVRIGVNAGSLEKDLLEKYSSPTKEAILESAKRSIGLFNDFGYDNIVVSIKSSDVIETIEANELFSSTFDYPLHLGITEAGEAESGIIRSSVGIGSMLLKGIGDTIRVSLTGNPVDEVYAAKEILTACNKRAFGVRVISCPTCGRTRTDILPIIREIKERTKTITKPINVAVMGCVVNGPGEAREADLGIACTVDSGVLFRGGEQIKKVKKEEFISTILEEIDNF